jgi:hypothetical protein
VDDSVRSVAQGLADLMNTAWAAGVHVQEFPRLPQALESFRVEGMSGGDWLICRVEFAGIPAQWHVTWETVERLRPT